MKICKICNTQSSDKWYLGPLCHKCYSRDYNFKNKERLNNIAKDRSAAYRQTPLGRFKASKFNAERRKITWALTFEQFQELIKNNSCIYCNNDLPKIIGGLDRKNNEIGYTVENSAPCCTNCNKFKGKYLSFEEMNQIIALLGKLRNGKIW